MIKARRDKKAHPSRKEPPFNINISFNINPKHVLPPPSQPQFSLHPSAPTRQPKRSPAEPAPPHSAATRKRAVSWGGSSPAQPPKKHLDRLKKRLMHKLNNMDIQMNAPYPQSNMVSNQQDDSVISEPLGQCPPEGHSQAGLATGKSKVLFSQAYVQPSGLHKAQASQMMGLHSTGKPKSVERKGLHKDSKSLTQHKYQSGLYTADSKKAVRPRRKSDGAPREETLRQKLERFKVDMMKLATVWDEGDVIKSRFSSSHQATHNLSPAISKELPQYQAPPTDSVMIEGDLSKQRLQEIRQYQSVGFEKYESEEFKQIKELYQNMCSMRQAQQSRQTDTIVEQYTITGEASNSARREEQRETEEVMAASQDSEREDSQGQGSLIYKEVELRSSDADIWSSRIPPAGLQPSIRPTPPARKQESVPSEMSELARFAVFLQGSIGSDSSLNFDRLLHQYLSSRHLPTDSQVLPSSLDPPHLEQPQSSIADTHSDTSPLRIPGQGLQDDDGPLLEAEEEAQSLPGLAECHQLSGAGGAGEWLPESLDQQIDHELQRMPLMKQDLGLAKAEELYNLEAWEESYKGELLRIKARMWREYQSISQAVQERIHSSEGPRQTGTSRKQQKMMKCLSEQYLKQRHQLRFIDHTPAQTAKQHTNSHEQLSIIRIQQLPDDPLEAESPQPSPDQDSSRHLHREKAKVLLHPEAEISLSPQPVSGGLILDGLIKVEVSEESDSNCSEVLPMTPLQLRMRGLATEDKEDIFEFIFLDLAIELYQEAIEREQQQQGARDSRPAQEERILERIKKYIRESHEAREERRNRKIGISTSLETVRSTLADLARFLLSKTRVKGQEMTNQRILSRLNAPLGPTSAEILKSLRLSIFEGQGVDSSCEGEVGDDELLVMDPELFLFYENSVIDIQSMPFAPYYEDERRDQQRVNFLRNCLHIHHKAIFDCLNEQLDFHRLHGVWGEPFAWNHRPSPKRLLTLDQLPGILDACGRKVIGHCGVACGLMLQREDSLIRDIAGDPQHIRKIQDERVFKLLEGYVFEMEEKWFFHDDEQTEIMVELAHLVWGILLQEVIDLLAP